MNVRSYFTLQHSIFILTSALCWKKCWAVSAIHITVVCQTIVSTQDFERSHIMQYTITHCCQVTVNTCCSLWQKIILVFIFCMLYVTAVAQERECVWLLKVRSVFQSLASPLYTPKCSWTGHWAPNCLRWIYWCVSVYAFSACILQIKCTDKSAVSQLIGRYAVTHGETSDDWWWLLKTCWAAGSKRPSDIDTDRQRFKQHRLIRKFMIKFKENVKIIFLI